LIATLLPNVVAVVTAQPGDESRRLLPGEERLVENAVPSRRREFAAGRACARAALQSLGLPEVAILADERRAPLWPDGVVGSITHGGGYTAAAVALRGDITMLGIDVEQAGELDADDRALIVTPEEYRRASDELGTDAGRVLFSAKESIYKAWYPATGRWLDFRDVVVTMERNGTFSAEPGAHLDGDDRRRITALRGRFGYTPAHIFTAVHALHEAAWRDD
jgi:4'-phosphopantetheinyl transferase EntD